jgi:hypothetical protein
LLFTKKRNQLVRKKLTVQDKGVVLNRTACKGLEFKVLSVFVKKNLCKIRKQNRTDLLPSAYLLSLTGKINNVWWCFIIAETISITLSLFFFARVKKNKIG